MADTFNIERKGVSEKVAEHIKKQIHENKYQAGQKIPGEREMAVNLNVSRNTVREAYKMLEAFGYLTIKHGTGVFVATEEQRINKMISSFFISTDQLKDFFAIRRVLENSAIEWGSQYLTDDQIKKLTEIVEEAAEEIKKDHIDCTKLSRLDHNFHLTLANMSQNSVLIRIMHSLIDLMESSRSQSMQIPGRAIKSVGEHKNILNALKDRDIPLAQKNMSIHLDSVENSIMKDLNKRDE
ncbi:FadR/GntR family transcriptional regulator [Scopulibacillus cellulosilyticus]|uniref:FadR/GntR family transcriptional regulator n=1 Tax=Scopulibacillus cellulosilyticus TaxID=2665665 RepID=A0ABW2Q1U3_9BACL